MADSPDDLVRATAENGMHVSVSRSHAERAGLRVLKESATDAQGRPLAPSEPPSQSAGTPAAKSAKEATK